MKVRTREIFNGKDSSVFSRKLVNFTRPLQRSQGSKVFVILQ
ncbi:hypothetical protein CKA32_004467 [Geitlerinema sp. FC II]|nr:hypothetical protein CKA32_004467 [Geitlerinema sp. FC II]